MPLLAVPELPVPEAAVPLLVPLAVVPDVAPDVLAPLPLPLVFDPEEEGGFVGLLLAHAASRPSRIVEAGLAIRETKRVMRTSVQEFIEGG
jgi:hypothetical protein